MVHWLSNICSSSLRMTNTLKCAPYEWPTDSMLVPNSQQLKCITPDDVFVTLLFAEKLNSIVLVIAECWSLMDYGIVLPTGVGHKFIFGGAIYLPVLIVSIAYWLTSNCSSIIHRECKLCTIANAQQLIVKTDPPCASECPTLRNVGHWMTNIFMLVIQIGK